MKNIIKKRYGTFCLIVLLTGFISCIKEGSPLNDNTAPPFASSTAAGITEQTLAKSAVVPLTVQTIAGSPDRGYIDGIGRSARFYDPLGIQLMNDGTLYVADHMNDQIRKITPPNIISTLELPKNHLGNNTISRPWGIGISLDGTIHVAGRNENDYMRAWIFRPGIAGFVTGRIATNPSGSLTNTLAPDLAGHFWYSDDVGLRRCTVGSDGKLSTFTIVLHKNQLSEPEKSQPRLAWTFMFANNGEIYLCPQYLDNQRQRWIGEHLYKYTQEAGLRRIYENLTFLNISSIIASWDSKTLYVADFGNIYRICNGKKVFLVGNTGKFGDGRDGVGTGADVNAFAMALSKDEKTIYFTDRLNRVRKLIL